jgi:hypothetical protein
LLRIALTNAILVTGHASMEWSVESAGVILERLGIKRRVKLIARRLWPTTKRETEDAS